MIGLSGPNFLNRPMAPISWCVLPSLSAWFGHFFGPLGLLFSRYFYITVIWLTQSRLFLTSFIYLSTILFLIIILSCFRHLSGRFPYGYYHMCLEGNVRVQTILLICDIDDLVGVSSWIFDRNNYHGWCFVKECFARAAGLRLFWIIYSIELEKGFLMGVLLFCYFLLNGGRCEEGVTYTTILSLFIVGSRSGSLSLWAEVNQWPMAIKNHSSEWPYGNTHHGLTTNSSSS